MSLIEKLKQSFISGLVVVAPLLITLLIIKVLAGWAFTFITPLIRGTNLTQYTANIEIVAQVIAIAFVITVITLVGYVSKYTVSTRIRKLMLTVIDDIPLFGTVYTTIKQISTSFTGRDSKFKKIVLVEFPRKGIYSIGLVTSEAPDKIEEATENDEEISSVFIPYSPNPTMGNLIMLPKSEYREVDMSVQKGMKLLLTTGIAYKEDEVPENIKEKHMDFFK